MNLRPTMNILRVPAVSLLQSYGFRNFPPPPNYDHIEFPEKPKLRYMDKVPYIPPGIRAPKMQKRLKLIRGPELIHNTLQHQQYGIMALQGGRLKPTHLEVVRIDLGKKMDANRMFAVWRVDAPWQPVTKKGQGQRMGGGKGAIDHYVTPIKAGRIILELGGRCEFVEVEKILSEIARKLPFKAIPVSQKIMEEMAEKEKWEEENNVNPYTMKYLIQNNMGGCHKWISPIDLKYFGKYL